MRYDMTNYNGQCETHPDHRRDGSIGSQVLSQLPSSRLHLRALVRKPDAAPLPSHVEVVYGDLTRPETLDKCLEPAVQFPVCA